MNQTTVRDKTFYRCTVHGPVILVPSDHTRFVGTNEFISEPRSEYPDSMLYPLDPIRAQRWLTGLVGLRGCVFRDCTFVDVGFMHNEMELEKLKDHIAGNNDAEF